MGLWFDANWAIAQMGELACYLLKLSTQVYLSFRLNPYSKLHSELTSE